MRPIVNGLQAEFNPAVAFVYLDAADRAAGQSAYERLALPGHPSYVILLPDGEEVYRGFGSVTEAALREKIEAALNR